MNRSSPNANIELERRHRATVRVVCGVFVLVIVLVVIAFLLGDNVSTGTSRPDLIFALWLALVISAIGVVVYRRAKFSALRLQAVANTRGANGLIASLQHTTTNIALICLGIAGLGFAITMLSNDLQSGSPLWGAGVLRGAVIAVLLLVGCYPRRAAWEQTLTSLQPSMQNSTTTGDAAA